MEILLLAILAVLLFVLAKMIRVHLIVGRESKKLDDGESCNYIEPLLLGWHYELEAIKEGGKVKVRFELYTVF